MPSLSTITTPPLLLAQLTALIASPVDAIPQRARASVVRRPVAESEATDKYLRPASRSGVANSVPSRGRGRLDRDDEQAFGAAFFAPPETTPSAAFLVQVIAQEVFPEDDREHNRTRGEGVAAYQAANERTSTYSGSILAFELRA